MSHARNSRPLGFALLEALIALLLISIGLLAVSKLQTLSLIGSGEGRSRTEAANISQQKLEELRNLLQKGDFTVLAGGSTSVPGSNAAYALTWAVSTPNAGLEQRLIQLSTTWTDANGVAQRLDLNSLVAWDDPGAQARLAANTTKSLISPTGEAQRGTGTVPDGLPYSENHDGTRIYTDDASKKTYLTKPDGTVILFLPPKADGTPQAFTTITGRVYFDENAGNNTLPSSANVKVRLSSEGECVYNNAVASLAAVSGGSNAYKYFTYTCYVGPGWYGNVGVTVVDTGGGAGDPTVCVGDPGFNGGVSNSTLTSAHPMEAAVRSYRGFRPGVTSGSYLSTGMAGGRRYGLSYVSAGVAATGPFDGMPRPSNYPGFYPSITANGATDYFNQDFLLTKASNTSSCAAKMTGGVFTRSAGKYVCISPDASPDSDQCPTIWPGFEGEVGVGGTLNYTLIVTPAGNGTGTVASSSGGITCGSTCSGSFAAGTSVTLTAMEGAGSSFGGWAGCTSVNGNSCTVTMSTGQTVTATFSSTGSTYALTVDKTGSGTVTSSPAGIACGGSCSASYASGASVTLTATPDVGATFTSWGGACSATPGPTCSVTMSEARGVTANFTTAVQYALTVSKAGTGSGTITSSPAGITCGATCAASYSAGTSVTLTANPVAGSTFAGWSGACSATSGACTVNMNAASSVAATFNLNAPCVTPVSGSMHDKQGTVTSNYGSCSMEGGNSAGYSCSFTAPEGTLITLNNVRTSGASYSYSLGITATCAAQTNVNFPQ